MNAVGFGQPQKFLHRDQRHPGGDKCQRRNRRAQDERQYDRNEDHCGRYAL